jgi:hypothetical protein
VDEVLTVVAEIPKGSPNDYEMDHDMGELFLDRMLKGDDEDPLRALRDPMWSQPRGAHGLDRRVIEASHARAERTETAPA